MSKGYKMQISQISAIVTNKKPNAQLANLILNLCIKITYKSKTDIKMEYGIFIK